MATKAIQHGTTGAYQYHRCRCEECRAAQRVYNREYQRKRKGREQSRARLRCPPQAPSCWRCDGRLKIYEAEFNYYLACTECGATSTVL